MSYAHYVLNRMPALKVPTNAATQVVHMQGVLGKPHADHLQCVCITQMKSYIACYLSALALLIEYNYYLGLDKFFSKFHTLLYSFRLK